MYVFKAFSWCYSLSMKVSVCYSMLAINKISFERGPQGERGPGLEASKINFDRVFAFV